MRRHTLRSAALAGTLALSGAIFAGTPTLASCLPLDTMLPDPSTPGAVVFLGTVSRADALDTDLAVGAWYLGDGPTDLVALTGGREIGAITSADWRPQAGEQFVVVAQRAADGSLTTGTCQQSAASPSLLNALLARYGEPQLPPFPAVLGASPAATSSPAPAGPDLAPGTSGSPTPPIVTMSPFPAPMVEGSPTP
jgi:hypothetical protein